MRLDDPALVAAEYADDARLRRRAAAYTGAGTVIDARGAIVSAVAAARPRGSSKSGCGWGELARADRRRVGAEVSRVDLSPRMVELARAAASRATVDDVQQLPFADGSSTSSSPPGCSTTCRTATVHRGDRSGPSARRPPRRDHELDASTCRSCASSSAAGAVDARSRARTARSMLAPALRARRRGEDIDGDARVRRPRRGRGVRARIDLDVAVRREPAADDRRAVRRAPGELDLRRREGSLRPRRPRRRARAVRVRARTSQARQALYARARRAAIAQEPPVARRSRRRRLAGCSRSAAARASSPSASCASSARRSPFVDQSRADGRARARRGLDAEVGDVQRAAVRGRRVRHGGRGLDALPRARISTAGSPSSRACSAGRSRSSPSRTRSDHLRELRELIGYRPVHSRSVLARERRGRLRRHFRDGRAHATSTAR